MKSQKMVNRNKPSNAPAKVMKKYLIHCLILASAVVISFAAFTLSVSGQATVFGPKTYTRTAGPPNIFQESFTVSNTTGSFTLVVQNGDAGGGRRVSSGDISLNGVQVVRESEFNQQVGLIQKTVSLQQSNTLRVQLRSALGSFITISILRDPTPTLSITSPLSGTVFRTQPITVEGTIDVASSQVTVNGVPASVSGGRFIANNVPLPRDGNNIITATGAPPGGVAGQASIMVILDTQPPSLVIDGPANGFTTSDETISVTGMVSDVITPTPSVQVNGIAASVNNNTFIAMGIPLGMGANNIRATARDAVGNESAAVITVNRAELPGLRMRILSGQAQSGLVNSTLPAPLRMELLDVNGNSVPNREVLFQVVRGDGTIKNSPPPAGQTGQRALNVRTDATGQAAVQFALGSRTGAGNNRVQVSVAGGLSPVEFCATATSGAPNRIAIIPMSNQQTGVINQPLAMPFACVVLDIAGNPVAGVPVLFQVTEGGGKLGGNPAVTETTGADGVAHAVLTLGPEPGTQNNVVTAAYQGQTDPPIVFAASGRASGVVSNTTFSGLVLDNGDRPLRNARAVISGTNRSALTDAAGRFLITNVPPGPQQLFIDASAITDSQGRIFPNLEFDLNVISGVENSLPMPVYLPPLATEAQSVARITGPVTTPIVLQIPGLPEATLTLLTGTIVSNHTGSASAGNPITVRLSRVNNDRVPMPPPNGSAFTLAGTVQPSGTHFDPPARICVPNSGMPPGAQVDIYSFDHDVGQFVSIGFATVSEDGSLLCSNPGFGIGKAGWWGGTPPPPPTTEPKNCRVMLTVNLTRTCIGEQITYTASTSPTGGTVTFGGDQGTTPNRSGNNLTTSYSTPGRKTVTATCGQSTTSISVDITAVTSVTLDRPQNRTGFCVGETGDFTAHLSTPLQGIPVTFEVIDLSNNSVFDSVMASTNSQGLATVTLEATTVGRYNIRARCGAENPAPFFGPVQVIRLDEAQAKRNDESDAFFQKDPGGFCVGNQINGRATTNPNMAFGDPIKWELRLTGFISDSVKASGVGNSFANQNLSERGTWKIIFYCDSDGDGQFDGGVLGLGAEPNVQTEDFEVMEEQRASLTVSRHVDTSFTATLVDGNLSTGSALLRRKDRILMTGGDWRCCLTFQRSGSLGTFGATGDGVDIITTNAELNSVFAQPGNVKVVTSMFGVCNATGVVLGCGASGGSLVITVSAAPDVWVHEWGHVKGLPHNDADVHYIMHSTAPNTDSVTESECQAFER